MQFFLHALTVNNCRTAFAIENQFNLKLPFSENNGSVFYLQKNTSLHMIHVIVVNRENAAAAAATFQVDAKTEHRKKSPRILL